MREHISTCLNLLEKENIVDQQVRWEYLKYAVRKFSIKCSKAQGKIIRLERVFREKKLKNLQNKILKKKKKKNEKSSKITLKVALLKAKFEQIIITTKKPLMKQKLIIIFVLFSNIFIKKHNFLMLI